MMASAWRSPRKDAETAVQLGERWIDEYEDRMDRSLTPAEMARVHSAARRVASYWGWRARADAAPPVAPQEDVDIAEISL